MAEITTDLIYKLFNKDRLERMYTARRYYANENDIVERKRMVVGPQGEPIEAPLLSNNRLSHAFTKELVRQKVNYLLGKPFNITGDDQALVDRMNEVCNKRFRRMLSRIAKDAILCGDGWVAVYYDEGGNLSFRRIRPESIGVVYSDDNEEQIELVVRRYAQNSENSSDAENKEWLYEVWTRDSVVTYRENAGKLARVSARPQFTVNGEGSGFDRIPIVRFRYNDEGQSILDTVKTLIDDYDRTSSDLSNLLCDTPNSLRVVKGYSDPIEELVRNLATFNAVKLGEGGDLQVLQNQIDIQAHQAHLDRLRKDIYDTACAVDTQEASQGNLSGVAIKFRYADLDLDCNEMGSNFSASMEELTSFVCQDMRTNGQGEHDPESVDYIWATELIANESEVIQNLMNSADLMSLESRVENHPYVNDPQREMERIEQERNDADTRIPGEWQTAGQAQNENALNGEEEQ